SVQKKPGDGDTRRARPNRASVRVPVPADDFEADTRADGPDWSEPPPPPPPAAPPAPPAAPAAAPPAAPPSIHQMKTAAPLAREPIGPAAVRRLEAAVAAEPRRVVSTTQKTGRIHRAGLVDGRYQIEE